jgi:hypothetical protein
MIFGEASREHFFKTSGHGSRKDTNVRLVEKETVRQPPCVRPFGRNRATEENRSTTALFSRFLLFHPPPTLNGYDFL